MIEKLIKTVVLGWLCLSIGATMYCLNEQALYYKKTIVVQQKDQQYLDSENSRLKKYIRSIERQNYTQLNIKQKFIIIAAEYDMDYRMPYAIACYETGNFTSNLWVNKHNAGGMKCKDGWCAFENELDGITAMIRNLKKNYINKGLDTLEEIQPIYCPNSDTWTINVKEILNSLE